MNNLEVNRIYLVSEGNTEPRLMLCEGIDHQEGYRIYTFKMVKYSRGILHIPEFSMNKISIRPSNELDIILYK